MARAKKTSVRTSSRFLFLHSSPVSVHIIQCFLLPLLNQHLLFSFYIMHHLPPPPSRFLCSGVDFHNELCWIGLRLPHDTFLKLFPLFLLFSSTPSLFFLDLPSSSSSSSPLCNKSDKIRNCISPPSSLSLKRVSCLGRGVPDIAHQTFVTFQWSSCPIHHILSDINQLLTDCGLETWREKPRLSADCCYLC